MSVLHPPASQKVSPDRTPVVALDLDVAGLHRRIWLKLECHNPHGSLKDRTAETLWESVRDRVHPTEGVIESTSGNLGIALAARCSEHSVPFTAVVESRTCRASIDAMRSYGARVAIIDCPDSRGGYLLNRLAYVREQIRLRPLLVWTNQYENEANPRAHRERTAPELWDQIRRPATVLLAVSTGGTLAGFHQFAQQQQVPWSVVGVDIEGSLALADENPGKRILPGIGSSQRSAFALSAGAASPVIVSAEEAVAACLWILDVAGISLGGSSGALIAAALRWFRLNRHDATDIALVCPDGGDRYQGTIYSAVWRKNNIVARSLTSSVKMLHVHRGHRETNGAR